MPAKEYVANQATNQQQVSVTAESHTMNVEFHLRNEIRSDVELQNEVESHFDSNISRDAKLHDRDVHSVYEVERKNEETKVEPILSKYVKRHYPIAKIIADKDARPKKINRQRNDIG